MTQEYDIGSLIRKAFKIDRGKPFDGERLNKTGYRTEPKEGVQTNDTGFRNEIDFPSPPEAGDEAQANFLEMRESLNVRDHLGRQIFMPVKLGGFLLPNEPTITINSKKNIIETALAGSTRRGTVKELISIGDWEITIRGIALNTNSTKVYPEDMVHRLNYTYGRNEAIEIESALTNLLGIYRVVIKSVNFPEMTGIQHAQAYEFQCVSDEDFDLVIE